MDIASSIQKVVEEIIIKLAKSVKNEFNIDNLCLAGGVALNCVANGKLKKKKYSRIYGFSQQQEMQVGQLELP